MHGRCCQNSREGRDDGGIELTAGATLELLESGGQADCLPVRAVRHHRRQGVARGHDPTADRDRLAGEPVGIALAVPALMARADEFRNV